jgi:hypothetical protein
MFTMIGNLIAIMIIGAIINLLSSCAGTSRLESLIPRDKQWPEGRVRTPSGEVFVKSVGTRSGFPPGIIRKEPLALYFGVSTDYEGCTFSIENIRVTYVDGTVMALNPLRIETGILTIGGKTTEYKILAPRSDDKTVVLSFTLKQLQGKHSFTHKYSISFQYDTDVEKIKYNPLLDIT